MLESRILVLGLLVAGATASGIVACGDGDGDADSDGDGDCDPACDAASCEECVEGTCESTCSAEQTCDGAGTCLSGLEPLGGPCSVDAECSTGTCFTEAEYRYPDGFCTNQCTDDMGCDGGRCALNGHDEAWDGWYCTVSCDPADPDCRPGLTCYDLGDGTGFCFLDACDPNPCTDTENSDGACTNTRAGEYSCGCADGFSFDPESLTCEPWECPAEPVEADSSTAVDTCTGTSHYNGQACTSSPQAGMERLYRLDLAAGEFVTVAVDPVDSSDVGLWVTTGCFDYIASQCVVGSDRGGEGESETVPLANSTDAVRTYYVVVEGLGNDSAACGTYDLFVEPPFCGDSYCTPGAEDQWSCEADCQSPECGNAYCDWGETDALCYADCGRCGDGLCTASVESAASCPDDCS